jgi:glycosyltransferase involved in cell wall biosynthesis
MHVKLREISPDVVDCQTYRHNEGIIISAETEKLRIPCFLTTHAPFVSVGVRGIILSAITRLYDIVYSANVLKRFKKIIAISKWEYPYLNKLGVNNERISHVPNGIPVEFFKGKRKSGSKVRKVLFFGRVAPVKDVETLLRAWALIEKSNNRVLLEIIGPAELEYRKKLDELIKELRLKNVKFGEAVFALNEKIRVYNNAEVFVLPSKREGMPQSLIEAMACGNIAIASDIIACREIVKNGKNGFLFKQGDENDLAERLEMVILNYKKLGGIAKSAREYAREFSWNKIADRLEKLYKSK